jgi:hypothetical protein
MFIPSLKFLNKTDKKIYAYDIKSLYPYVLAKNDFPIGEPAFIEITDGADLGDHLNIYAHLFVKVRAPDNLTHPILQLHHPFTNLNIAPVGTISGWFFSEELKIS